MYSRTPFIIRFDFGSPFLFSSKKKENEINSSLSKHAKQIDIVQNDDYDDH